MKGGAGVFEMDERDGDRGHNSSCNAAQELPTKGERSRGLGIGMINRNGENRILEATSFWGW